MRSDLNSFTKDVLDANGPPVAILLDMSSLYILHSKDLRLFMNLPTIDPQTVYSIMDIGVFIRELHQNHFYL